MKPVATQAPIDPNVKIPSAVAAAAAKADAALTAAAPPKPDNPTPAPAGNELIKIVPPTAPAPVAPLSVSDTPAPAPTAPTVTPQGNPDDNDQSWKQKANSAEGRYAAQLRINSSLQEQVTNLTNLVETLSTARAAPEPTPAPIPPAKLVTQEEIDAYGPDFIDIVQRIVKQSTTAELEQARGEIATLKQQMGNTVKTVVEKSDADALKKMEEDLAAAVPDWEQVNLQDNFLAWLQLPNVYTGVKRHDELRKAWAERKTPQVIAFFKGFLSEEAALLPTGHQPSPSTPAPLAPAPSKTPLGNFAAPGRARTPAGGSPPPAEKPTFTASEISAFYRDVNRGVYKGRDDEKARIENMIWDAQREGRIKV